MTITLYREETGKCRVINVNRKYKFDYEYTNQRQSASQSRYKKTTHLSVKLRVYRFVFVMNSSSPVVM